MRPAAARKQPGIQYPDESRSKVIQVDLHQGGGLGGKLKLKRLPVLDPAFTDFALWDCQVHILLFLGRSLSREQLEVVLDGSCDGSVRV